MQHSFTIFFTFFADGDIRRKYIEIAIKPLLEKTDKSVPIIVIDASSAGYSKKNKALFVNFNNLTYINDTEINPFARCKKYLHLIETEFVLRLLEDCAYINLFNDNLLSINNDVSLMQRNEQINVVQYPIINDQTFVVKGNTILYPKIKFYEKELFEDEGYKYYDRSTEREIYHYLCNNILYRTIFFKKHWNYYESKYIDHNSAESSKPNNKTYQFFFNRRYTWKLGIVIHKWYEKIFHPSEIIRNIFVTEAMGHSSVVHIGYYSTEIGCDELSSAPGRGVLDNNNKGVTSVLKNLAVFSDSDFLDQVQFQEKDDS